MIKYYSNPVNREKQLWQNKDFRERMLASRNTPESKAKHSKALKEYYRNNPEAKEKQSERQKEHYQNHPETRVKISEAIKGRIWITDGNNTKMISGNDSIPDGWRKGRK